MKRFILYSLLLLSLDATSQISRIEGMKQLSISLGFTRYNINANIGYNIFTSKKISWGAELHGERGNIGFTNLRSLSANEIFNYSFFNAKLHKYKHIVYYSSLLQTAGFGYEYIENTLMREQRRRIFLGLGIGLDNEVYFESPISIGVRIEQRFLIHANVGSSYWLIMPEIKYNF